MLPKQFTKIKYRLDESKRIHLLFQNEDEKFFIYFDGIGFTFGPGLMTNVEDYSDLKISNHKTGEYFQINSIKQTDYDMTFILFDDGTIFQIYFMMDDEESAQGISEFGRNTKNATSMTPLGITVYEAARKRYDAGEECEIRFAGN